MERQPFGTTGVKVSPIGLGAAQAGYQDLDDAEAGRLLNGALDAGVTFIDTARGYDLSETRIRRHIGHRRAEFVLSTKVGYGIRDVPDWTGLSVTRGIEEALQNTGSECLDIVHLHSCEIWRLEQGEVIQALDKSRTEGKIRLAAYSGDNEPLNYAVRCGRFQVIQTSLNLFDQRGIDGPVRAAREAGLGVIAKRPVGNAPWRFTERPAGDYCEAYWERMKAMSVDPGMPWAELAIRFRAHHTGAHTAITGTGKLEHLLENVRLAMRGPLPEELAMSVRDRFRAMDNGWTGQV